MFFAKFHSKYGLAQHYCFLGILFSQTLSFLGREPILNGTFLQAFFYQLTLENFESLYLLSTDFKSTLLRTIGLNILLIGNSHI